jgi:hypothetical protein
MGCLAKQLSAAKFGVDDGDRKETRTGEGGEASIPDTVREQIVLSALTERETTQRITHEREWNDDAIPRDALAGCITTVNSQSFSVNFDNI